MWIEKTRNELNASERKARLLRGLLALIAWTGLAYLAATSSVWRSLSGGSVSLPIKSVIPGPVLPWIIAVVLIGALYWLRRTRPTANFKTQVCPLCNRIKTNDGVSHCDCGGVFRGIHEMKWVEGFSAKPSGPTGSAPKSGPPIAAAML